MRNFCSSFAAVVLVGAFFAVPVHAADKLKGFYSGSGGISAEVHRVLFVEFAADGTALLQQKWHDKDPQTWHAHWKRDGKKVTITYDAMKDATAPDPLILTLKGGALTATSWDLPTLGVLGPPQLTPFGGKNAQVGSVAACQSLNTLNPNGNCVTWSSNQ
jgi:hypothetical protein